MNIEGPSVQRAKNDNEPITKESAAGGSGAGTEQKIAEAEGLLKELAGRERAKQSQEVPSAPATSAGAGAEASPAWAAYAQAHAEALAKAKEALAKEGVTMLTPEERARETAYIERLKATVLTQGAQIERQAQETNSPSMLKTIQALGTWYNQQAAWKKIAIGGGLLALGIPGAGILQKAAVGMGMFATIQGGLERYASSDGAYAKYFQSRAARVGAAGLAAAGYALFATGALGAIGSAVGSAVGAAGGNVAEAIGNWLSVSAAAAQEGGASSAAELANYYDAGMEDAPASSSPAAPAQPQVAGGAEAAVTPPAAASAEAAVGPVAGASAEASFNPPAAAAAAEADMAAWPREIPAAQDLGNEPPNFNYPPVQGFGDEAPLTADLARYYDSGMTDAERPSVIPDAQGFGDEPPLAQEAPQAASAPATPPAPELFSTSVTVEKGDTLWKIVERGLGEDKTFAALDRAQKDFMIDSYLKSLDIPNKDSLAVGQPLDLSALNNQELHDKTLDSAHNLTDAQKQNILRSRVGA